MVHDVQAYYFAKTSSGKFTDNENSMAKQRETYDDDTTPEGQEVNLLTVIPNEP